MAALVCYKTQQNIAIKVDLAMISVTNNSKTTVDRKQPKKVLINTDLFDVKKKVYKQTLTNVSPASF